MSGGQVIKGIIFDLDGVIVSTDECHYTAWKEISEQEGIPFDRKINQRLRGVSRMESLGILLEKAGRAYSPDERVALAGKKNEHYRKLILKLTPEDILPGVSGLMNYHRMMGLRLAIGSSSRNAAAILERIGLQHYFDAVVDGNQISRSKPDPEVFLLAAARLGLEPRECLVYEDAEAGLEAARRGGFPAVFCAHT